MSLAFFHLVLYFVVGGDRLQRIVFSNLEVGWVSKVGSKQKCDEGIRSVVIIESLWQGGSASPSCNWNLVSLSANFSSLERLVPTCIGHVLSSLGQCNTSGWTLHWKPKWHAWVVMKLTIYNCIFEGMLQHYVNLVKITGVNSLLW